MKTNDIRIELPYSKSISNRLLVLNHQMAGHLVLSHISSADDTKLLCQLLSRIESGGSNVLHCENAGTVARFLTALLAITPGSHFITGSPRLCQRPIAPLVDALNSLGLKVAYAATPGRFPLQIEGATPTRKLARIDCTTSSQFASALLLIAPSMPNGITVTLEGSIPSRTYIDMTCSLLSTAGLQVKLSKNKRSITVSRAATDAQAHQSIQVERDWSAAAFFYQCAALRPDLLIRFPGLGLDSVQGDKVAAEYFQQLGVTTTEMRSPYRRNTNSIRIKGGGPLKKRYFFTFRHCPDLMPSVAVTCAAFGIDTVITGIETLRNKESDRIQAVVEQINAIGGRAEVTPEGFIHIRRAHLDPSGHTIATYGDHRIAMALAPLQLIYSNIDIQDAGVVSKSFPLFWEQFDQFLNEK